MRNIREQDTNRLQRQLDTEQKLAQWAGFYDDNAQAYALARIQAIEAELQRRYYW